MAALALALALKFCLHKRLSNLHLHKVRQLPFAGIWQIDSFSFSTAFYLPSQYFLLSAAARENTHKAEACANMGQETEELGLFAPFCPLFTFHSSLAAMPPCHALVFCFELRDFVGPTFFRGSAQITVEIGPGQLGISTATVDSRFVSCVRLFLFRCPLSFVRMPTTPFFAVPFIPIPLQPPPPPPPPLHLFFFASRVVFFMLAPFWLPKKC